MLRLAFVRKEWEWEYESEWKRNIHGNRNGTVSMKENRKVSVTGSGNGSV